MVKMMDIKILTTFSIVFVSLMVSNEFLEFLVNILYTAILFIIVLFFYQNKHHFIETSTASNTTIFNQQSSTVLSPNKSNINTTSTTKATVLIERSQDDSIMVKEQSPGEVKLIYNYSKEDNDQQLLIQHLQNKNQELSDQLNKSIEIHKQQKLEHFNESEKLKFEIKELSKKSIDQTMSISILNSQIENQRQSIQELTKERDSIYSSEQKVLSKLTEFEKKEKSYIEQDKQSQKKISEFKDQVNLYKKEVDEKVKKISKLESQLSKIEKEREKEKKQLALQRDNSSSSIHSDTSNSSSTSSTATLSSIPIPINNINNNNNNNNSINNGHQRSNSNSGLLPSPSSSVSPPSSSGYLKDAANASDNEQELSSSSEGRSKFKSLFNKVKSESSRIAEKAQKNINKHLGSDFFNPTNSTTPTNNNNHIVPPITIKESTPVKNNILFDLENDKLMDNGAQQQQSIQPMKVSPRDPIQKEQSLSDLFIKSSNISFSNLDSFLNTTKHNGDDDLNNVNNNNIITSSSSSSTTISASNDELKFDDLNNDKQQQQPQQEQQEIELKELHHENNNNNDEYICNIKIKTLSEYSIKSDENKNGLRRAKKKPAPGSTTMMEDVSIAKYPFLVDDESIGLFGVFDGHAGRGAAESASKLFPLEFEKLLKEQEMFLDDDQSQLITKAFKNVDSQMKDHEYEGCTATISLIWKTKDNQRYLQCGNVGDSSAFLCRNDQTIELTFDHKANDPSEKQRMIDSGIPVGENQTRINGVAVSRSLGNHFIKEQNIGMISDPYISNCYLLTNQDKFIIIASDGLWDVIKGQEAVEKLLDIYETSNADQMASLLLETAVQSSICKDNVSVIVVKL